MFLAVIDGGIHHVGESSLGLLPLPGLQAAVRVDPKLIGLEILKHLCDATLNFWLAWDTGRVDIVDTGANVAGVGFIDEDLEKLGIALAVLNAENIGIESGNGMEEVLELGVAEMRVDLGRVLDARGRELERVNGPRQVVLAFTPGAKRQTLAKSGLVDLDDVDAGFLEVDDFVSECESKLLCLDGLVNVIPRERPSEAGNWTCEHTLHWALRDRGGVLGLLDGHWCRSRDVADNDWWAHTSRAV